MQLLLHLEKDPVTPLAYKNGEIANEFVGIKRRSSENPAYYRPYTQGNSEDASQAVPGQPKRLPQSYLGRNGDTKCREKSFYMFFFVFVLFLQKMFHSGNVFCTLIGLLVG